MLHAGYKNMLDKNTPTGSRPERGLSIVSRNNPEDLKDNEESLSAYLKKRKNCVIKPRY